MTLTDAEIEELIEMETRATARPWEVTRDGLGNECDVRGLRHDHVGPFDADNMNRTCSMCRFIASARNALPSLLAEVKAARQVIEAALAWESAKADADENAHLMLSSVRTSDEASIIMETLFAAERAVIGALTAYDAAKGGGK